MNKGQGAGGGILALLLAGLFVRGTVTSDAPRPDANSGEHQSVALRAVTPAKTEGPWMASCDYWSSSRSAEKPIEASAESPCGLGDAAWGIPGSNDDSHTPEISAIIATVPDPIHSHLALDFDRAVDTLLLAAADNRYLGSYYWLPWRSHVKSLSKSESGSSESGSAEKPEKEDKIREQEPGLVILRYAPAVNEWDADRRGYSFAAYHRVIYLFLVAETPALGVNGTQLQNAFRYEQILRKHGASLTVLPSPFSKSTASLDKLSIIGPFYSGSAASLHEGIESAKLDPKPTAIEIAGVTSTSVAARELDPEDKGIYHSFGENSGYEQDRFVDSLRASGYELGRVAVLSEAGTVFGKANPQGGDSTNPKGGEKEKRNKAILSLRFPRELSLLRNAQPSGATKPDSAAPSPYLNLSLKDYAASDDTEPRFSTAQSPLSVEAQLMAIAHQLQRSRVQFIIISASNILDDIFLAQFLHRACPDTRIVVVSGGDLLFERDTDNTPYVGSISISPYLLTALSPERQNQWLYSDVQAEAIYNAASFIFWDRTTLHPPQFAGYLKEPDTSPSTEANASTNSESRKAAQTFRIPLWAAVVGSDGYYPLAVLNWCASDFKPILPAIQYNSSSGLHEETCRPDIGTATGKGGSQPLWQHPQESIDRSSGINPSLPWGILAATLIILCLGHAVMLFSAQYWSPFTRDLAIDENDQPRRRTIYLTIGTAVLVSMAYVTAFPLLRVAAACPTTPIGSILAWTLLASGVLALIATIIKTRHYFRNPGCKEYLFFNIVALATLVCTITAWTVICVSNDSFNYTAGTDSAIPEVRSFAGLYFSYRCLHVFSGVCPLIPILLLLLAWFFWSLCQTSRLRFSEMHRPRIPMLGRQAEYPSLAVTPYPLFVPDEALQGCERPTDNCLYHNITTLLITREVIRRFCISFEKSATGFFQRSAGWLRDHLTVVLGVVYAGLFLILAFMAEIKSLDHFVFTPVLLMLGLHSSKGPTLYEFLIISLFFPLVMVAISGWLRTILIWGALSRGLLEPLERAPIRCAFSRVKGGSWMSMLSQSGLHIRWRDMSRSNEAIRQIVNHPDLTDNPDLAQLLSKTHQEINWNIRLLMFRIGRVPEAGRDVPHLPLQRPPYSTKTADDRCSDDLQDLGPYPNVTDLCLIRSIEVCYAEFCQILLHEHLVPYWDRERIAFVEDCSWVGASKSKSAAVDENTADGEKEKVCNGPSFIDLAEELLVVRYVALIRAVLVNIRYLMLFVATVFVLTLVAWNSYPFHPHAFIDWCFTILLAITSVGFISVFAQMHRNAILSRITDSKPNELGWDFYVRIITFGGIPVLTWLAYQFPQIGGSIYRILQPGLQGVK
jgi:hypothetical protein